MKRLISVMGIMVFFILGLFSLSFSAEGEDMDTLTITTYYPSPYGSYNELEANKMAIGDTNKDGILNSDDQPADYGDLLVAGNVSANTFTIGGGPSLPTCNSSKRGKQFLLQSGSGTEDGFYICKKKKDDTYAWLALGSPELVNASLFGEASPCGTDWTTKATYQLENEVDSLQIISAFVNSLMEPEHYPYEKTMVYYRIIADGVSLLSGECMSRCTHSWGISNQPIQNVPAGALLQLQWKRAPGVDERYLRGYYLRVNFIYARAKR